jgi:GNAT superfamily N-acetyltransferase
VSGPVAVPFADRALAQRFERAEALSTSRFAEARARLAPESGACWIEVAGAHAVFDGVTSPLTQTFGLGMFQTPAAADLERLEAFFAARGAPTYHEVSPLADPAVVPLLNERGYRPFEFTSVMYRPIAAEAGPNLDAIQAIRPAVRELAEDEQALYARTAAAGWAEFGYSDFMLQIGSISANTVGMHLFIAELDGEAIAAAAMNMHEGVAHLAGATTIPAARRRGAQLALLEHRLQYAAAHGCDLALMGAAPGSGSQRNAERNGFRIAYTRAKWKC